METARGSMTVKVPVGEIQDRWQDFIGKQAPPAGGGGTQLPDEQLPDQAEKGHIYFAEDAADSTTATLELHYNPDALREAGKDRSWLEGRIEGYLTRFKEAAEA